MQNELFDYPEFLHAIKERIKHSQMRAVASVNIELIKLYWSIGNDIVKKQREQGWGAKIIETLSRDLHASFPDMKVFRAPIFSICGPLHLPGRIR